MPRPAARPSGDMRFLCEQCKAKYQISDEKVAGKTVRMKCRKCGHMIEVRADVTETSVASSVPAEAAAATGTSPASKPGTLPRPATKPIPPRSKLATNLTSSAPPKGASQNPSALAGAFQRTVAGAPSSSMRPAQSPDDSAALDMLSASANPWYVAINGVPVGPVRLSELRRKAQSGIVTESSLVWQEGVEEWRPVKTFPELAQIVREAAASGRPSLVSSPPAGMGGERVSQIPASPAAQSSSRSSSQRPAPARAPMAPRAATPAAGPTAARSNVVPIASRMATTETVDADFELEPDDRDKTTIDVSGSSAVAAAPFVLAPGPSRGSVAPDPFAAPPPAPVQMSSGQGGAAMNAMPTAMPIANPYAAAALSPPISIAPAAPKREVPWTILALFVAALAFGITAAIVLFTRQPIPVAPVASASAPAALSAAPSASVLADVPPVNTDQPADSALAAVPDVKGTQSGAHATKTVGGASTGKAVDPSIADLLRGSGSGPATGGGGGGGGGSSTSALTASEIEGVVNNRKTGVTRTCWERSGGNLSSANVTCHVTIAANGSVQSSTAEGSDPVIAKCIETQVKSWTFPPSSGSTQVNLPFHFVRQ